MARFGELQHSMPTKPVGETASPSSCSRRPQLSDPSLQAVCLAVILRSMTDVTLILSAIERGDPHAAEQLLPLVYNELRKLAAAKLAQEKLGQTLDATALVHEAYLRLVASRSAP